MFVNSNNEGCFLNRAYSGASSSGENAPGENEPGQLTPRRQIAHLKLRVKDLEHKHKELHDDFTALKAEVEFLRVRSFQ